jgi:predicted XRE-type DNA-binding protein
MSAKQEMRAAIIRELRQWRVSRGLTQMEAAERFGVSRNAIGRHYASCSLGTLLDLFESIGGKIRLNLQGPPGAKADPRRKRS